MIVEDDPWYGKILQHHLSMNPDYRVTRFLSGKECLEKPAQENCPRYN